MAVVSFVLPDEDAGRFSQLAEGRGGKSALLRRLVAAMLSQQSATTVSVPARARKADRRIELLFTDDEMAQIEVASAERQLRRATWLTALVRRRLAINPKPAVPDGRTLDAIRSDIRKIGVNVNQIAAAANGAKGQAGIDLKDGLEQLATLQADLKAMVQAIGQARRGDLSYWETPE